MAHHGSTPFNGFGKEQLDNYFKKAMSSKPMPQDIEHPLGLGATGNFPDGKIIDNDEGEIMIGITTKDGRVILDFGKPVHWIGFTKEQATQIGETLIKRSEE